MLLTLLLDPRNPELVIEGIIVLLGLTVLVGGGVAIKLLRSKESNRETVGVLLLVVAAGALYMLLKIYGVGR